MLRPACCSMVASALHLHLQCCYWHYSKHRRIHTRTASSAAHVRSSAATGTTTSIGGYLLAVLVAQHTLGRVLLLALQLA